MRVLVVDDSALVRKLLTDGLHADPDIQVVGTAGDPYLARDLLVRLRPDVITLDVEMPRMDGISFLRRYMRVLPTPTIVLSALTQEGRQLTIDALFSGAVDVLAKPASIVDDLPGRMAHLRDRVRAAAASQPRSPPRLAPVPAAEWTGGALSESTDKVIALGASTGGVEAIARTLPRFPAFSPGIVVVEHMPAGFTAPFAERLDRLSTIQVKEAADGDRIRPGLALVAPGGDRHLVVRRSGGQYRVHLVPAEPGCRNVPSVDRLFESVATAAGANAAAALLTGMGTDGAAGLKAIRWAGGRTFAQDEETSTVFGMPAAAWKIGAAERLVPLPEIAPTLLQALVGDQRRPHPATG